MASIRFDAKDLLTKLTSAQSKTQTAITMYAQEGAKKFENYAKSNRRWRDRTGHARQRLLGYVEKSNNVVRINIAHGVKYGIYLEMAHEQRFAILKRTVEAVSPEVLKGFKGLMGYLK